MRQKIKSFVLMSLLIVSATACGNKNKNSSLSNDSISNNVTSETISSTSEKSEKGYVRGKILSDSGQTIIAGIIVEDSNGKTKRYTTNALGAYDISLEPGEYKLTFTKGYEFSTITKQITVEGLKKYYLQDVRLTQLCDSYANGWIAGDLHQHTYYSDGQDSVQSLLLSNVSQGLYYGFLSDHNVARGMAEWYGASNFPVLKTANDITRYFTPLEAVEETTEFGHYQSIGVPLTFERYDLELYASERTATNVDDITKERILYICDSIKRAGGIAQINHPYSVSTMGFKYWELAKYFDTIEIWNGVFAPCDGRYEQDGQNYKSKMKWYECLNSGLYLPCTGGTDNHDTVSPGTINNIDVNSIDSYEKYYNYYNNSGKYSGMPTTYLNIQGEINRASVMDAIKKGNSFLSIGPVVDCKIGEASYGDTYELNDNSSVTIKTDIFNRDGITGINIVKNGESAKKIDFDKTSQKYNQNISIDNLNSGDWLVIEVYGPGFQYAITNPIFLH